MYTRQAISIRRNTEALSNKHCCSGKAISVKYSECVSAASVTQHAKPMRHIILSLVCLAIQLFTTLFHKRHDFRNKVIEHKMSGNKMPTWCNRGFYCRSYCLLNMFRAPLCPSSGVQEYYTVVAACGISCCGFQVAGLVCSWRLCVRFAGGCSI